MRRFLSLATLLLASGCVHSTTVSYLPNPDQPRLSLAEGRDMLARFGGVDCARLRAAGHAAGETDVLVLADSAGAVTSSELRGSSGDARLDGVIGAVAAQLRLDPAPADGRATVHAGFRCGDDDAITATLERR